MAKKAPKGNNKGKRNQPTLPGAGRQRDKELDGMILELYRTRTERIELQKDENEMAVALIEKMKAKKRTTYVTIDGEFRYPCEVTETATEKVKIKQEDA